MTAMNRHTGKPIGSSALLSQRIADVLTTRIGTRVMRRNYGSLLPELIDAPGNEMTSQLLIAASATALVRWIPELALQRVGIAPDGAQWSLTIEGASRTTQEQLATQVALGA